MPGVLLKDLPQQERPQERLERLGAHALADRELLAMIIRSGTRQMDVLALADELLKSAGSLSGLLRWDTSDFQRIKGIGKVKALQLSTQTEIAKRMIRGERNQDIILDEPQKVWDYLFPEVRSDTVEKVWVLCLDRKNKLIHAEPVTSGTATSSLIHPREIFRPAIRWAASAIILAHNHPTGDPTPSHADLGVTQKMLEASKAVDIDMLDHVILGEPEHCPNNLGYYSFSDSGLIS
ncbi:MAG: DNA repair protein RadC [Opitutales bacterium]|nr:DNA repair protein RadC [Opitutales bacterium]